MPIFEYPIARSFDNIALRKDGKVMAFYRVPSVPITITDDEKKKKHKERLQQLIKKLAKNKNFEMALVPKDYILEEN